MASAGIDDIKAEGTYISPYGNDWRAALHKCPGRFGIKSAPRQTMTPNTLSGLNFKYRILVISKPCHKPQPIAQCTAAQFQKHMTYEKSIRPTRMTNSNADRRPVYRMDAADD